jgi:hypothetical protein
MKKLLLVLALGVAFVSCKSGENTEATGDSTATVAPAPDSTATPAGDSTVAGDSTKTDSTAKH